MMLSLLLTVTTRRISPSSTDTRHAPLAKVVIRSRPTAPWYDTSCVSVKANTRRLDQFYRASHTPSLFDAWRNQLKYQRYYMQERYREYWTNAITDNLPNLKLLWLKVSQRPTRGTTTVGLHTNIRPQTSPITFGKKLTTLRMGCETHHQLSSSTIRRQL